MPGGFYADLLGEYEVIRRLLSRRTWAIVGLSADPARASNRVGSHLLSLGYHVIPVNPQEEMVLGQRSYPSVLHVPEPVHVVDVFRRSEAAGRHVDEAIQIGAGSWLQLGVFDDAAEARAAAAGLDFVMDRCPRIELPRLGMSGPD